MKTSFLVAIILALVCFTSNTQAQSNPSYGNLAQLYCSKWFWTASSNLLNDLNAQTQPTAVRNLRQSILMLRDMVDVFAFAFPNSTSSSESVLSKKKKEDIWDTLRSDLNDGYTFIGNFQDLSKSGINYTQQELNDRRNSCLAWSLDFQEHNISHQYYLYTTEPSLSELFYRSDKKLSDLFWGSVTVRPRYDLSGYQNLAMLMDGLLNESRDDLPTTLSIIHPYVNHTEFHDYRKLVRGIITLSPYFPEIYSGPGFDGCTVVDSLAILTNVYDKFGKINDEINAYDYYVSKGNVQKAQQLAAQIDTDWPATIDWIQVSGVEKSIECLDNTLIQY